MIHRPFRLPEIFNCLINHKIEPKRMKLIYPFEGKEPNLVLIEARKNANARLKFEENLIVYEKLNEYTKQIDLIYGRDWGNLQ
jgi:tRNA1Val (adenine37-N6)-methyltransferase